jgi:hypothetical protein
MNESRHGCKWRVRHIRLYCSTSVSTYRTATRTASSPICQASSFSIRQPRCHKQRATVSVRVVVIIVIIITIIIIILTATATTKTTSTVR